MSEGDDLAKWEDRERDHQHNERMRDSRRKAVRDLLDTGNIEAARIAAGLEGTSGSLLSDPPFAAGLRAELHRNRQELFREIATSNITSYIRWRLFEEVENLNLEMPSAADKLRQFARWLKDNRATVVWDEVKGLPTIEDVEISLGTLADWCEDYGIRVGDWYRQQMGW